MSRVTLLDSRSLGFALALVLGSSLLSGCASMPYRVEAEGTPTERHRWHRSIGLRTAQAQYWLTFAYLPKTDKHTLQVSMFAPAQSLPRVQPTWLKIETRGGTFVLERWTLRTQSDADGRRVMVCYGEVHPRCALDGPAGEHWVWTYALPSAAVRALQSAASPQFTLGSEAGAVYQELEPDEQESLQDFFAATTYAEP